MARTDKVVGIEDAGNKKDATPFSADTKKAADVGSSHGTAQTRLWSTQAGYTIAVAPGKNAAFKKHVLVLESSDPVLKTVRETRAPEVKEVLDKPFQSDEDLAKFNKFLQNLVFNGEAGRPNRRGIVAVLGLFDSSDGLDVNTPPDLLIMKAIRTKSFKEGI